MGVKRRPRWVWPVGLGALVVTLVAVSMRPKPLAVDLATVHRGDLELTLDQQGLTRVQDRFVVSAPVAGQIRRIGLAVGAEVTANSTPLVTFLPGQTALLDARAQAEASGRVQAAQSAIDQASAEQARQQTALSLAQDEQRRSQELFAQDAITEQKLDESRAAVLTAQSSLRAAQAAVERARHDETVARAAFTQQGGGGTELTLRAPVSGRVLRRMHESAAFVPAGEPIVEIGNPQAIEVTADFLSQDAVRIHPGMPVHITQWGGERPLEGRVRLIEPQGFTKVSALGVEEQRVNVVVVLTDPPVSRPALGDGYRVAVSVVVWQGQHVLQVPSGSLFRQHDGWAAYVVRNGKAHVQPVVIGTQGPTDTEVRSGLQEGDRVIPFPSEAVKEGMPVVPAAGASAHA